MPFYLCFYSKTNRLVLGGMNAKEARAKSEERALIVQRKKAKETTARRMREAVAKVEKHKKFYKQFLVELEREIGYAVEDGRKSIKRKLASTNYLGPDMSKSLYGKENYFKNYEFGAEVKRALGKLRREGYTADIDGEWVEHDDSGAYLNSGGEMGSQKPYHTYDTVLRVKW